MRIYQHKSLFNSSKRSISIAKSHSFGSFCSRRYPKMLSSGRRGSGLLSRLSKSQVWPQAVTGLEYTATGSRCERLLLHPSSWPREARKWRALLLFAVAWSVADGRPWYADRVPNGRLVPGVQALGHVNAAGSGPRNEFGSSFAETHRWTADLCCEDSDHDGQWNGYELGDR